MVLTHVRAHACTHIRLTSHITSFTSRFQLTLDDQPTTHARWEQLSWHVIRINQKDRLVHEIRRRKGRGKKEQIKMIKKGDKSAKKRGPMWPQRGSNPESAAPAEGVCLRDSIVTHRVSGLHSLDRSDRWPRRVGLCRYFWERVLVPGACPVPSLFVCVCVFGRDSSWDESMVGCVI